MQPNLSAERQLLAHGYKFDAPVNTCAFSKDSSHFAFGLGDGHIILVNTATPEGDRIRVKAHHGAVPALYAYGDGFLSLSDDGTLKTIAFDGTLKDIADFKGAWTDKVAVHDKTGAIAVANGKNIHLWTARDAEMRIIGPHPFGVNDVCFAADGMGLAAAHRDGVTLWAWPHFEPQSNHLPWKGAHLAITVSQDKKWIVTAMQEGALHMWNVSLKRDYQMRGYWTKPTKMAWSGDGKWLGSSGSETVILWPFDKQGPEGREALQLGWSNGAMVSALVGHPNQNVMAAGFEDGALLLLDIKTRKAFNLSAPSGHPVTATAFARDGFKVIAGVQNGGAIYVDLES
ncbi:MAG TPA: hypothetical protein VIN59_07190 [Alphaproteobacteria bacterium]